MNLKELEPLNNIPAEALREVEISGLSEGAAFLLLALRTGAKPKPADVLAVCRRGPFEIEPERFYLVNVLPTYEFLYADRTVDNKRVRRLVSRLRAAAQELADAAGVTTTGDAVDMHPHPLERIIKPRRYKPRPRRTSKETRKLIVASIRKLTKEQGYPPTYRQVAKDTGISVSTVHQYAKEMKEEGRLAHDGQHTLRVVSRG